MRYCALAFLAFLFSLPTSFAQKPKVELYLIKVVTIEGNHLKGILEDVSSTGINIGSEATGNGRIYDEGEVPLSSVKKIVLRRHNRKRSAIQGSIIGALVLGYAVVQTSQKNGFRSPTFYGLNLGLAMIGGAGAGGLIGYHISPISRKVIRPQGRDREDANENLRRQLAPFTYSFQSDFLNRTQP